MTITTAVRERPILFSSEMVRAILEGRKTQTRRVMKPQPTGRPVILDVPQEIARLAGTEPRRDPDGVPVWAVWMTDEKDERGQYIEHGVRCPYGQPGDRLWVRESLRQDALTGMWEYEADFSLLVDTEDEIDAVAWVVTRKREYCPSIHMPRWASRITLEITDIRVERLQEIRRRDQWGEADTLAEGLIKVVDMPSESYEACYGLPGKLTNRTPWTAFARVWDEINEPRGYGWEANPWVWVITFRRAN